MIVKAIPKCLISNSEILHAIPKMPCPVALSQTENFLALVHDGQTNTLLSNTAVLHV